MTTVQPQILSQVAGTTASLLSVPHEYRHRSSDTVNGFEYYGLWDINNGAFENVNHDIKVNTSTNVWSDYGGWDPDVVYQSGTTTADTQTYAGNLTAFTNNPQQAQFTFLKPTTADWIGSGSSGGGGIGTLSGGTSPEIKDVVFSKVSDSIVYLSFNWQNLNTAFLFVNSGGTVTQTNISLGGAGQSGSIGSSGYLTSLNEGDKCWIANTDVEYIHRKIHWSVGVVSGVKSVIGKTYAYDTGNTYDLMFYSYVTRRPTSSTTSSIIQITHDGTLQTVSLPYDTGRTYKMLNFTEDLYGSPFEIKKRGSSSNFW